MVIITLQSRKMNHVFFVFSRVSLHSPPNRQETNLPGYCQAPKTKTPTNSVFFHTHVSEDLTQDHMLQGPEPFPLEPTRVGKKNIYEAMDHTL